MKESVIEKKVKEYGKKLGFTSFKFSSPANKGVPDQIFLKKDAVIFIEFKTKTGKLSALQEKNLHTIGKNAYVVNCVEDGEKLLNVINEKILNNEFYS